MAPPSVCSFVLLMLIYLHFVFCKKYFKMPVGKYCGCKGIRTCLICEKDGDVAKPCNDEIQYVYNYCSYCNLCWPNDEATASLCDYPLYLGKIKLVPEFCTKKEESTIISFIDRIPWMSSQSGRRKQDFGPKVNFKKKRVKIGQFKGFPKFAESVIKKFQDLPELSDFDPVELCNLEYIPERGSSIDPHVDDFWLWGQRLVTVNLNSATVLTLIPCSEIACECFQEANHNYFQPLGDCNTETNACKHIFQASNGTNHSLENLSKNSKMDCKHSNFDCEELKGNFQSLCISDKCTKDKNIVLSPAANGVEEVQSSEIYCNRRSFASFEESNTNTNKSLEIHHDHIITKDRKNSFETGIKYSTNCEVTNSKINSLCNVFRTCSSDSKICVRIVLPPRSLFVLSGCARYNWFHEIKRQDVVFRRLAMTFRELSEEFLDEGKESQCGKELLLIAKSFYDL